LIVVSDTSPVLNLARIGRLELLHTLFDVVLIPTAVYAELRSAIRPPDHVDVDRLPWIVVVSATDRHRVEELAANLDLGEAEAIVVALERNADLLLVDERRGRRTAAASGLTVTGLLGVVAHAKRVGAISVAKPVLDDLINTAHFWIGPALYAEVLTQLDETTS
jgi:predicted nucleic acid-binding protein